MAAVHGFVAGWGMGAFALIMMTVLAPAMPSAALGWAPGAAFGLGTTAVLAGAGAVIGALIRRQRLPRPLAERVAQEGAGWTLLAGGVLFTAAGAAGLAVPSVMTAGISTGIHVRKLDQINIGTLLVILIVAVAAVTITRTIRRFRHLPATPWKLVLLARPGDGQSTQARQLAARLGVTHLPAGELLRQEAAAPSAIGVATTAAGHGSMVTDDLAEAVLRPRPERAAAGGGYVLDGFPRDLAQARALALAGQQPQAAVSLDVSAAESRQRLLARAQAEGRGDDTPAAIGRRLAACDRDMPPVLRYYEDAGILVTVDGDGTPAEVTERILARVRPVTVPALPAGRQQMDKIMETYRFGPHRVTVLQRADDEGMPASSSPAMWWLPVHPCRPRRASKTSSASMPGRGGRGSGARLHQGGGVSDLRAVVGAQVA
jgi:adenylate kinase